METPIYPSSAPNQLTFYRGGLNVGIFYPGPPVFTVGSSVIGNEFAGKSREYKASGDGNGIKNYGWILILGPTDISDFICRLSTEKIQVRNTSNYDGYYNKSQASSRVKTILNQYNKGGYKDWYIPSRDELAFIAKNLPQDFEFDYRISPMNNKKYASSTYVFQNQGKSQNKVSLLLSQSFDSSTYGDTILVSDTKSMAIRPVRRVPVYII
jgi:hypothetical protein